MGENFTGGFLIEHPLQNHPLFQMERLIQLTRSLAPQSVEYNSGKLAHDQDHRNAPKTGLTVVESLERLEEIPSWIVLKNVEQDPDYARLMHETLKFLTPHISEKSVLRPEAFIFVSSASSVTPYHMDPEHNFLMQIRGTKTVTQFNGNDRSLLTEGELEAFHFEGNRTLKYQAAFDAKGEAFELKPGVGMHIPVTNPHWVRVGEGVSISLSITFRSNRSDKKECLHRINAYFRKKGVAMGPVGKFPLWDSTLYSAFRALSIINSAFHVSQKGGVG